MTTTNPLLAPRAIDLMDAHRSLLNINAAWLELETLNKLHTDLRAYAGRALAGGNLTDYDKARAAGSAVSFTISLVQRSRARGEGRL